MQSKIVNGCTKIKMPIIDRNSESKYGAFGISALTDSYRIGIRYNKQTYYLGIRKTLEEARALRFEAEAKIAEGTFIEWFDALEIQHRSKQ